MSQEELFEKEYWLKDPSVQVALFGVNDANLLLIEETKNVSIQSFGDKIKIIGAQQDVWEAYDVLKELANLLQSGIHISEADVVSALKMSQKGTLEYFKDLYDEILLKDAKHRPIRVKNRNQREYIRAIQTNDLIFGIGPAGTGKTYLAVVMAVKALKNNEVDRIILTRPAVEAGESLGFLPGDLKEKVDPYLRPVYDALHAVLGTEHTERLIERGVIEIAPLAYMRGRTLEKAFVILDESQNTTKQQMKMFLTRLGFGSKMVVNGDKTQIDLPKGHTQSGLVDAKHVLQNVPHIAFVEFDAADVVRHPVVSEIIKAYAKHNE